MAIWLNEADVRALISMRDLIETIEGALRAYSEGRARQPVRSVIEARAHAFFGSMPAYVEGGLGAKLVTVFEENAARGLPTHQAVIVLFDPETGVLLAVMDGRYITEARTAAVSAVAARMLAREDARTLAILGSGVQAGSHLEALALARNFEDVRCWSPSPDRLQAFVSRSAGVRAAANAEEAVRGADVVALVTSSPTPALRNEWVAPGACVISIGACRPNQREMDPELITRGRLFVDSRAAALVESGDVVMGIAEGRFGPDHILAELGEAPGRTSQEEITIFKSLGLAVEDVAAARLVYERAHASGRGVLIN